MSDTIVRGDIKWKTVEVVAETCCNCGMPFYMPKEFQRIKLDKPGSTFYCPAGHPQHYVGKSKDERIAELERDVARQRDMRLAASNQAHQAWITKQQVLGKLKAVKHRASAGVCPCCTRTFSQLARHMKAKHPTYGAES